MLASDLIRKLQRDETLAPLLPALETRLQGDGWSRCATLRQPDRIATLLEAFALEAGHPGGDPRAIASLWSRWYFHTVMTPLVAALVLERACPVPHAVRITAGHGVCGLHWAEEAPTVHALDERSASEYPIRLAGPVIQALALASGTAPRVFWNNLGNLLEYLAGRMRPHPRADTSLQQALDAMLDAPALADGSPNPVRGPVRYQADTQAGTIRVRRLCCLYYLLPGTELCGDCPRLHPHCAHRHVST
ncbi:siderophore-iron reductase FhuF [uncultured Castellaniella sp.]|uniref:siderophore-iron reductase FhuF n=1 Tax=uncultured Castellaniella sp. TaxID=647907 RepID=UPI0026283FD6|nr:siderophore-iron reductase FhuF [uncultured Castellaniella sp.]